MRLNNIQFRKYDLLVSLQNWSPTSEARNRITLYSYCEFTVISTLAAATINNRDVKEKSNVTETYGRRRDRVKYRR